MYRIVVALLTLALGFASAKTYTLTLYQPSVVAGTELKAGEYRLEVNGTAIKIKRANIAVESAVRVEQSGEKFGSTSVRYTENGGKMHIREIRLGGTKTMLVLQ